MANNKTLYLEGNNNLGVLLLHSLAGDPSQMKELGKKLNKQGYSVLCPLYKGHGTDFLAVLNTGVNDWYQSVTDGFDELSKTVEGIYVIGMSIGGGFAVKLAEEKDVLGLITLNAPIIGFDVESDVFAFRKNNQNEALVTKYRKHRLDYFHFVIELGQISNLKKITCPLFIIQGSLDIPRYKTSSQMLLYYVNSEVKQRKDYSRSFHLILLDNDKKEVIKDIIAFIKAN